MLSDNSGNAATVMHSDFYCDWADLSELELADEILHFEGQCNGSLDYLLVFEFWILVYNFKPAGCHVGLADSLNFLNPVLCTELVEGPEEVVEEIDYLFFLDSDYLVEVANVAKQDCDVILRFWEVVHSF